MKTLLTIGGDLHGKETVIDGPYRTIEHQPRPFGPPSGRERALPPREVYEIRDIDSEEFLVLASLSYNEAISKLEKHQLELRFPKFAVIFRDLQGRLHFPKTPTEARGWRMEEVWILGEPSTELEREICEAIYPAVEPWRVKLHQFAAK